MNSGLNVFGLTGGIATGKSTFASLLSALCPEVVIFDADECVDHLYSDNVVLDRLEGYFSNDVMTDGQVDKGFLRQRAFSSDEDKIFLEDLFHPLVRKECLALLADTAKQGISRLFVADVPLLFENGFDFGQSTNLLVATSKQTQIDRLKNRNAWQDGMAEAVIASQIDIEAKLTMADVVFWNEGSVDVLQTQCSRFLRSLDLIV